MKTLNIDETRSVAGGEVGATGMGNDTAYAGVYPNGTQCANSMLFWGGVGSGIGAINSGFIGFFAGAALGGFGASLLSRSCQMN